MILNPQPIAYRLWSEINITRCQGCPSKPATKMAWSGNWLLSLGLPDLGLSRMLSVSLKRPANSLILILLQFKVLLTSTTVTPAFSIPGDRFFSASHGLGIIFLSKRAKQDYVGLTDFRNILPHNFYTGVVWRKSNTLMHENVNFYIHIVSQSYWQVIKCQVSFCWV